MSVADVVVLVAAVLASVGAVVTLAAAWVLVGQVRRLERGIEVLRHEAVPLVEEARQAAGHAAAEIARVDAVLADTESVTATVDRAARIARRVFANPVVKVLAWRAGAVGGFRQLRQPSDAVAVLDATVAREQRSGPPSARGLGARRRRRAERALTGSRSSR
ncbi:MAG: hypothetical protein ACRDWE_12785 [Acidimicrobiales bacterium]